MSQLSTSPQYDWRTWFAFLVPSLIGVFLFMTPVSSGEAMTIPIAMMAKAMQVFFADTAQAIITDRKSVV